MSLKNDIDISILKKEFGNGYISQSIMDIHTNDGKIVKNALINQDLNDILETLTNAFWGLFSPVNKLINIIKDIDIFSIDIKDYVPTIIELDNIVSSLNEYINFSTEVNFICKALEYAYKFIQFLKNIGYDFDIFPFYDVVNLIDNENLNNENLNNQKLNKEDLESIKEFEEEVSICSKLVEKYNDFTKNAFIKILKTLFGILTSPIQTIKNIIIKGIEISGNVISFCLREFHKFINDESIDDSNYKIIKDIYITMVRLALFSNSSLNLIINFGGRKLILLKDYFERATSKLIEYFEKISDSISALVYKIGELLNFDLVEKFFTKMIDSLESFGKNFVKLGNYFVTKLKLKEMLDYFFKAIIKMTKFMTNVEAWIKKMFTKVISWILTPLGEAFFEICTSFTDQFKFGGKSMTLNSLIDVIDVKEIQSVINFIEPNIESDSQRKMLNEIKNLNEDLKRTEMINQGKISLRSEINSFGLIKKQIEAAWALAEYGTHYIIGKNIDFEDEELDKNIRRLLIDYNGGIDPVEQIISFMTANSEIQIKIARLIIDIKETNYITKQKKEDSLIGANGFLAIEPPPPYSLVDKVYKYGKYNDEKAQNYALVLSRDKREREKYFSDSNVVEHFESFSNYKINIIKERLENKLFDEGNEVVARYFYTVIKDYFKNYHDESVENSKLQEYYSNFNNIPSESQMKTISKIYKHNYNNLDPELLTQPVYQYYLQQNNLKADNDNDKNQHLDKFFDYLKHQDKKKEKDDEKREQIHEREIKLGKRETEINLDISDKEQFQKIRSEMIDEIKKTNKSALVIIVKITTLSLSILGPMGYYIYGIWKSNRNAVEKYNRNYFGSVQPDSSVKTILDNPRFNKNPLSWYEYSSDDIQEKLENILVEYSASSEWDVKHTTSKIYRDFNKYKSSFYEENKEVYGGYINSIFNIFWDPFSEYISDVALETMKGDIVDMIVSMSSYVLPAALWIIGIRVSIFVIELFVNTLIGQEDIVKHYVPKHKTKSQLIVNLFRDIDYILFTVFGISALLLKKAEENRTDKQKTKLLVGQGIRATISAAFFVMGLGAQIIFPVINWITSQNPLTIVVMGGATIAVVGITIAGIIHFGYYDKVKRGVASIYYTIFPSDEIVDVTEDTISDKQYGRPLYNANATFLPTWGKKLGPSTEPNSNNDFFFDFSDYHSIYDDSIIQVSLNQNNDNLLEPRNVRSNFNFKNNKIVKGKTFLDSISGIFMKRSNPIDLSVLLEKVPQKKSTFKSSVLDSVVFLGPNEINDIVNEFIIQRPKSSSYEKFIPEHKQMNIKLKSDSVTNSTVIEGRNLHELINNSVSVTGNHSDLVYKIIGPSKTMGINFINIDTFRTGTTKIKGDICSACFYNEGKYKCSNCKKNNDIFCSQNCLEYSWKNKYHKCH
jgi:hypothetical protein